MSTLMRRDVGAVAILTPRGYLTGGEETEALETAIKELSEAGNLALVLNLSETQHLNSTALGVLISAHSNYLRRGGRMALAAVDKRIQNIFVITKLSLVFESYASEDEAIASLAATDSR